MISYVKQSTVVHMFFLGTFVVSGLFLNAIQAVNYFVVRHFNRRAFREMNKHLIYGSWAQIVTLGQWWSGSTCRLWAADQETLDSFGSEHGFVVMNHTYEIDFVFCWMICDMLDILPTCKTLAKRAIAAAPVVGWTWYMGEQIFLERNWEKDRQTLPGKLDNLLSYEESMLLLMFSEGTRFTPEKHTNSLKFAQERNLPKLKYHLLPRPKGFAFCANHFHDKMNYLYDIELIIPKDSKNPANFRSLLNGRPIQADMFVKRYAFKDLPADEEQLTQFIYKMYEEKDRLMEYYHSHGNTFPKGSIQKRLTPRWRPKLIQWGFMISFTIPMLYWTYSSFASLSLGSIAGVSVVYALMYGAINKLVGLTETSKTGSAYGVKESAKKEQ